MRPPTRSIAACSIRCPVGRPSGSQTMVERWAKLRGPVIPARSRAAPLARAEWPS